MKNTKIFSLNPLRSSEESNAFGSAPHSARRLSRSIEIDNIQAKAAIYRDSRTKVFEPKTLPQN